MSDKTTLRGIHYFDLAAVLLVAIIALGHLFTEDSPAAPAVLRDIAGFWGPMGAVAALAIFRRRAYTQTTPWIAASFAALAVLAIAAIFWRGHIMVFMAAMLCGAVVALAGLVLRTRRVSEALSRSDCFGLVAMVGSVTLTVMLAEVALRAGSGLFNEEIQQHLHGADPNNVGVSHPYIGHLHTPNNTFVLSGRDIHAVHNVDGLGFRNTWPWPERADIVAVGDSVTFGQGVNDHETWPYLVAQNVAPRHLVNLGLIGAGPHQYLRVFETYGAKLRPKLLLVGVFARNDFWDAEQFEEWLNSGLGGNYMVWRNFGRPQPVILSLRHPRHSVERLAKARVLPVIRRSYLFTLLRALRGGAEGEASAKPRIFRFEDGRRLQLDVHDFLGKTRAAAQPDRPGFRLVLDTLHRLHSVAAGHGTHVLFVLLPGKEEVYLPGLGETSPDPTSALRSSLDKLGLEYLNLTPALRARAAAGEQLFFEVDGHPNREGQALIARLVNDHLMENAGRYGLTEDDTRPPSGQSRR